MSEIELTYGEKQKRLNDAFLRELKELLNRYNACIEAKDEDPGYPYCDEDIHIRIVGKSDCYQPFVDIDLGCRFY